MTEWLKVNDSQALERAAEVIGAGGLVILPTDTVYGVAADPWQPQAVAALYAAKKRSPDRAIPILLADFEDIHLVASTVPTAAQKLAAAFWPGPLTIAVPKKPSLPIIVSTLPTVGVRIPDHDTTRAVIRAGGGALAVTSANLSDRSSVVTAHEAADALDDAVTLVLDGGPCPGRTPSTVVDVTGATLRVIRPGPLTKRELLAALRATDTANSDALRHKKSSPMDR